MPLVLAGREEPHFETSIMKFWSSSRISQNNRNHHAREQHRVSWKGKHVDGSGTMKTDFKVGAVRMCDFLEANTSED